MDAEVDTDAAQSEMRPRLAFVDLALRVQKRHRVMLEIYIVRHAFRMSTGLFLGESPSHTLRDPPLTAHGVDQTKELATYLATQPIERIYSSPYWRCLQTATPTAEALDLRIHIEHGISEWYGPARSGLHPRPPEAKTLAADFPLVTDAHQSLLYPPQKGETVEDLHERAKRVLDLLIASIDAEPEETRPKAILLVSHAATLIALGRALIGDDSAHIGAATASVSRYRRTGSAWTCTHNADCSFLTNGTERDWDFSGYEVALEDGPLPDPDTPDATRRIARL